MYLQLFDQSFGAMRTIAVATSSDGRKLDLLTPLSEPAREELMQTQAGHSKLRDVVVIEHPRTSMVGREMLRYHGIRGTSLLVMRLVSDGQMLGSLVLVSEGPEGYSEKHAKLLSLLKEPFVVAMSNTLEHREVVKLKDMLADDNRYLHDELLRLSGDSIIGANLGLRHVMEMIRRVATLDSPVLLLGETGVGKDVIGGAIHSLSQRRDGPFIKVNSGAIPETLLDSELFGHERGAFTGALTQKRGRFERAHQGTIFLDEIGELPSQAQIRLLRVLQEKVIERVGGTKTIQVDIRIIAATHRNLEEMVQGHQFREDLWFRLNVFPIEIPPLRKRKEDIPSLVHYFVDRKSTELKLHPTPKLAPAAIDSLMEYHWPGNVRELENTVERALILNRNGPLNFDRLILTQQEEEPATLPRQEDGSLKLDEVISRHIRSVLKMTKGKVHGPRGAAEVMGLNPSTLRNRMNKLGISYGRWK
jgi:transcriptional regulator with GAF, ATPase, and Fis domain